MQETQKIHAVSSLLLDYAVTLMAAGSHTARVVRNVVRLAESQGYDIHVTVFQKTITMMIIDRETKESYTAVKQTKPMPLNFRIISNLSSLSWEAYDHKMELGEIRSRFEEILREPRLSRWIVLFLVACANAAFCKLFGGDSMGMLLVFVGTLIAFYVRQEMMNRHMNHLVVFVTAAFIASITVGIGNIYELSATPDIALGTSVLFLIPGVPLINSLMDILEGHVLGGVTRMINATLLIMCISIGFLMTLLTLGMERL